MGIHHNHRLVWGLVVVLLSALATVPRIALDSPTAIAASGGEKATILKSETIYEVSGNKAKMTVHKKVQVNTPDGDDYSLVVLPESDFRKLKSFSGRVCDTDGAVVYELDKDDVTRHCGYSGYAVYSDICFRAFDLSSSRYPFVAEFEYEYEIKSQFFWPDWSPQMYVPVEQTSYTLIVPDDFEFVTNVLGVIPEPLVEPDDKKTRYTWEMRNIPAFEKAPCSPPHNWDYPTLQFAARELKLDKYKFSGNTWTDLSRGKYAMTAECYELSDEQRQLVDELKSRTSSQREFCDSLHGLLSDRLRYVAIEIGVGGWLPSRSSETFERGYGDCKDLATLYVSLLNYAGIKSRTALILTRREGLTDPAFPGVNRFNHVILLAEIEGDTVWADATCSICEFGDLPSGDEFNHALVIDPAVGDLVPTPVSTPEDNVITRVAEVAVNPDKSLNVRLRMNLTGNPRHYLLGLQQSVETTELEGHLKGDLLGLGKKFSVDSIRFESQERLSSSAEVEVYGSVRNAVHVIGGKQYLNLEFISALNAAEEIDLDDHPHPLYFKYPRCYCDTMTIALPESWIVPELPPDTTLTDRFGSVSCSYRIEGHNLIVTRRKTIDHYQIEPDLFPEFKEHVRAWKEVLKEHLIFART